MNEKLLIRAMSFAEYYYDDLESYDGYLRFFTPYGVTSFTSWEEVADWLEGVVFDDPEVADAIDDLLAEV